jgi:hypothetical protein
MQCEICASSTNSAYNVLREVEPIKDKSGQLWASYERVSGPHIRCDRHKIPEPDLIIDCQSSPAPAHWVRRMELKGRSVTGA